MANPHRFVGTMAVNIPANKVYTALGWMRLRFDPLEVDRYVRLRSECMPTELMARKMSREPEELAVLEMSLTLQRLLEKRPCGVLGNSKPWPQAICDKCKRETEGCQSDRPFQARR
jgi:hypothetical protein